MFLTFFTLVTFIMGTRSRDNSLMGRKRRVPTFAVVGSGNARMPSSSLGKGIVLMGFFTA